MRVTSLNPGDEVAPLLDMGQAPKAIHPKDITLKPTKIHGQAHECGNNVRIAYADIADVRSIRDFQLHLTCLGDQAPQIPGGLSDVVVNAAGCNGSLEGWCSCCISTRSKRARGLAGTL